MDFYDLRAVSETGAQPTIKTTDRSVLVTVPAHLAESAGFGGAEKVRVQLGEAGKTKILRLSSAERFGWALTCRRNVVQVFIRELMPRSAVPSTVLPFAIHEGGLDLTLPSNWALKDPHVLIRPTGSASSRRPVAG